VVGVRERLVDERARRVEDARQGELRGRRRGHRLPLLGLVFVLVSVWGVGCSEEPLKAVANRKGPAPERLQQWLDLLVSAKRSKALADPELFATYIELTADARDVVKAHVDNLVAQLAQIVADGVTQREFETTDPAATGRTVFDATARFHNPAHAPEWSNPGIDAAYERVRALVLNGLTRKKSRRA
jgi:hypothetical protein